MLSHSACKIKQREHSEPLEIFYTSQTAVEHLRDEISLRTGLHYQMVWENTTHFILCLEDSQWTPAC